MELGFLNRISFNAVYREEDMQRKWFFTFALLLILFSTLLIIVPNTPAFAHNGLILDTPTPTPDANTILNKANDVGTQAQNLNTVITIGLLVVGAVLAAITIIIGIFAFLGISSLKEVNDLKAEMRKGVEDMIEDTGTTRNSLLKEVNDLKEQMRKDAE